MRVIIIKAAAKVQKIGHLPQIFHYSLFTFHFFSYLCKRKTSVDVISLRHLATWG